ncbi:hypothetical protein GY065_05465 [Snodgrassella sp. ESL0323]|uniref:hypothetical protein n=1 Tax=Snodgrassella sp. ESL0323 TaxID=2705034 RepID=UPI0015821970|nr:hypothetical protein [Snodgrassella sp. ESL0323]NUF78376.1 hypothetical protein [Snodgrassella sp. ESL0323]
MKAEPAIEMLQEIKNTIFSQDYSIKNDDLAIFTQIETIICKKSSTCYEIPVEIKKLLSLCEDESLHLLLNTVYNPLTPKLLIKEYTTDEEYPSFLNLQEDIEYMDNTIISEDAEKKDLEGLSYDDTQKDYIDTKISNIYEFMPLYDSGSFCLILIDLREQYFGRLINYVSGYAYVLAPNLYAHIDDLIDGLKNEYYTYDPDWGDIQYPLSWYQRKLLRTGEYYYDSSLGKVMKL